MDVNFYASYREIAGQKTVTFDIPEKSSIRDLVEHISAHFPLLKTQLLDEKGELHRHVHVFIDGRDTYYLPEGLETILKLNEKVDIFPPVAGGVY